MLSDQGKYSTKQAAYGRFEVTAEQRLRSQRPRKTRKRRRLAWGRIFFVLIMLSLVSLLIWQIFRTPKKRPRLDFVYTGVSRELKSGRALIIRDEELILTPQAGKIWPIKAEGAYAAKEERMAWLVPQGQEGLLQQLEAVDESLAERQLDLSFEGQKGEAEQVYRQYRERLEQAVHAWQTAMEDRDHPSLERLAMQVDGLLQSRRDEIGSLNFTDAMLEDLKQQRANLWQEILHHYASFEASENVKLSYFSDGKEALYTPTWAKKASPQDLEEALRQSTNSSRLPEVLAANQAALRLVKGDSWYLLLEVEGLSSDWLKAQKRLRLLLGPKGVEMKARLIRSQATATGQLLLLASDEQMQRYLSERQVQVQLEIKTASGLLLPVGAIEQLPGQGPSVLKVLDNRARRVAVEILAQDGDQVVVKPNEDLAEGALIVLNPDGIEEGEALDG